MKKADGTDTTTILLVSRLIESLTSLNEEPLDSKLTILASATEQAALKLPYKFISDASQLKYTPLLIVIGPTDKLNQLMLRSTYTIVVSSEQPQNSAMTTISLAQHIIKVMPDLLSDSKIKLALTQVPKEPSLCQLPSEQIDKKQIVETQV